MSNRIKPSLLPKVINKLFERLNSESSNRTVVERSLAPDDLLELSGLFGVSLVESALALIDSEKVKIYRSQSRSGEFIEIPGHNGIVYKLFPNINHCRCQTFNEQVLQFKSQYTCKHILAAKLAVHLGKEKVEIIADDLFNFLIQQIGVE